MTHSIHWNQKMTERTTDVVAVVAMASPVWLGYLGHISNFAAAATPILGALWLLVQICAKGFELWDKHKERKRKARLERLKDG